ncbi:hypothetical protein [Marisediminicola senii]|uniref:hypothetical protein n=1 Tax=Marisediminicola senii TaxID=2711233 RepID=UPI0013EBDAE2|nr:hypothetical protein [Marisediminicola senii]
MRDLDATERELVDAYLESKKLLARSFQVLAVERYSGAERLEAVKALLVNAMDVLYPTLPTRYKVVKGFGASHRLILNYLSQRVGEEVSAEELRVLTGDAVHTERRARELRDLGLDVASRSVAGGQQYLLRSAHPDMNAARSIALHNVNEDNSLTGQERANLARLLRVADGVTT